MAFRIVSTSFLRNTHSRKEFIVHNFVVPDVSRAYRTSSILHVKSVFRHAITKNLEIISNDVLKIQNRAGQLPLVNLEHNRPVVILLAWMLAQRKHVDKYLDLYLKKGFDILKISISVKQLLWPTEGSQIAAQDVVQFLEENQQFNPLLVHGFSAGGYVWGEVLVKLNEDLEKYKKSIISRIKGQIWDSTPDITEFAKGFPHALFPSNPILRKAVQKGLEYHLQTFHDTATQHYVRASQMFHTTPVHAPALVFIAKNDPIASLDVVSKVTNNWESMGMKTFMKCWDKSKHVSHFHLHRREYIETLEYFLSQLDELNQNARDIRQQEKTQAKAQM